MIKCLIIVATETSPLETRPSLEVNISLLAINAYNASRALMAKVFFNRMINASLLLWLEY